MKLVYSLLGIVLINSMSFAQSHTGIRMGNYSGVNGLIQNPASSSTSFIKWDVNIIAGGFFIYNGYQYVENTNLIHAVQNMDNLAFRSRTTDASVSANNDLLFYSFSDIKGHFDFGTSGFITGPSFMLKFEKFSMGMFINNRMAFGGNNADGNLSQTSLDEWQFLESKTFDKMDAAALVWSEIGLNFSTRYMNKRNRKAYLGINLKYNLGFDGFYVHNTKQATVQAISETGQLASGGPVEYAFATGAEHNLDSYTPGINGKGFGLDIGIQYIFKSFDRRPYHWRLGGSITDIGYVRFTKNAEKHFIPEGTNYTINYDKLLETLTIEKLVAESSFQIFGNPTTSRVGSEFTIITPVALRLTGDYSMTPNWFFGMAFTRRLDFSANTVEHENILLSTLRYERSFFELGSSLVLYNDIHPRAGVWMRIGPLTIGSDNIASIFIKQTQLTGTDFYFALKIHDFKKPKTGYDPIENCNFR